MHSTRLEELPPRQARSRLLGIVLASAMAVTLLTIVAPTPAIGATVSVARSEAGAATGHHVDSEGRVYNAWIERDGSAVDLLVGRTEVAGSAPDSTWGNDPLAGPGVRRVTLSPPWTTGSTFDPVPSPGFLANGNIVVAWPCYGSSSCVFHGNEQPAIDTYTTVGVRTARVRTTKFLDNVRVADDGSMVATKATTATSGFAQQLVWIRADGTTIGSTSLTKTDEASTPLASATVAGGKLYVADAAGEVIRFAATGTVERRIFSTCAGPYVDEPGRVDEPPTVFPGSDGELWLACHRADDGTGTMTLHRWTSDGSVLAPVLGSWSAGDKPAILRKVSVGASGPYGGIIVQGELDVFETNGWYAPRNGAFKYQDGSWTQVAWFSESSVVNASGTVPQNHLTSTADGFAFSTIWPPVETGESADEGVVQWGRVTMTPPVGPPTTAPRTPTIIAASGGGSPSLTVTTGPATAAAGPATGYRIVGYVGNSTTPFTAKDVTVAAPSATFDGLAVGQRYRFTAAATNAGGSGPSSPASSWATPPFASFDAFTDRQYRDFAGTSATTAQKIDWSTKLSSGTLTPATAANAAVDFAFWQKQSPIIRLYRAYFLRLPDAGGLTFWSNRSRGTWRIAAISGEFERSTEFQRRYGSLSNRQFVELVYQNVLGRTGDAGGIASWTGKLDRKVKTRGEVMVGFSESNEYKNKTKGLVDTVNVYTGMLRRIPTPSEIAIWAPGTATPPRVELVGSILASDSYDKRT